MMRLEDCISNVVKVTWMFVLMFCIAQCTLFGLKWVWIDDLLWFVNEATAFVFGQNAFGLERLQTAETHV